MERRILGRTAMNVSVLGFGGSEIGYQGASLATVERLLNASLDSGLNVIDTAACYVTSEELIGKAISRRRREYYLLTKCCPHSDDLGDGEWSKKILERSIERSLERLRTDCLDVVQLHSCSESVLREGEAVGVLQRARDVGKTRFIGYSGDGPDALYAVRSGAFDTLQISVNIADQKALDLVLPEAIEKNLGVIAKRPIANAVWRSSKPPADFYVRPYWDRLQKLRYEFLERDGDEIASIALRFTLSTPGVHTAIVGTKNPERWRQNAELLSAGSLSEAEYGAIRERWRSVAPQLWTGER